jgi:glycosyltransferase involved in cell wall biosynthesis
LHLQLRVIRGTKLPATLRTNLDYSMKTLIDFTQIPVDRTGVGVYAENLVRELGSRFTGEDELIVLVQRDEVRMREILRECRNVLVIPLPTTMFRYRGLLLLYEQLFLPMLLLWKKIDVVHSLHYTHPLFSPCPRVVTIHDLTFLLYPRLHTLGRRMIMPFFIKHAVKHAEALIFVSDATRLDAERLIPSSGNLRHVIPLGVDPRGFDIDAQETKTVLRKFSVDRPFVLFIGTLEPRKNIVRLIRAFDQIAIEHPDLLLVLAGKLGWDSHDIFAAQQASNHRDRIRHLGFVAESEKKALLVACEALIYPSLYEGFGLPVLEAMAAGAPVITSNISSLPEVAGEAAILVNPFSFEEIASALRSILVDDARRRDLGNLGKRRATNFNWPNAASQTYAVYKSVSQKRLQSG